MSDGDGQGLLAFTDWLHDKKETKPATAKAFRAAVVRVLAIDDELLTTQVSSFDLDQILARFENGSGAEFTSSSMETYKSRFRRVTEMYKRYLAGDTSWRTMLKPRNAATRRQRPSGAVQTGPADVDETSEDVLPASGSGRHQFVDYNLPLRPGLMVQLKLPADLTRSDAARIAAFVGSLAFDDSSGTVPLALFEDEGE